MAPFLSNNVARVFKSEISSDIKSNLSMTCFVFLIFSDIVHTANCSISSVFTKVLSVSIDFLSLYGTCNVCAVLSSASSLHVSILETSSM